VEEIALAEEEASIGPPWMPERKRKTLRCDGGLWVIVCTSSKPARGRGALALLCVVVGAEIGDRDGDCRCSPAATRPA